MVVQTPLSARVKPLLGGCRLYFCIVALVGCVFPFLAGCGSRPTLAASPNLYVDSSESPFASVPTEFQSNTATVLYATDRQSETVDGVFGYNEKRSRTMTLGLCTVTMGENMTWDDLAAASRVRTRSSPVPLALTGIDERGYFPPMAPMTQIDGQWVEDPAYLEGTAQATEQLHRLLAEQLAKTPRKEVFVYVHGYNNSFASGAFRVSQVWHFGGRSGVPVLYSWPAGSAGLLRGYNRDRESGEFTNAHLKQFLRAIASCPEVQKVHLIAHSRGTDILCTAMKELHIEYRAAKLDTRAELKWGHVILAAPDIDMDVFVERLGTERLGFVPERITIYVNPGDKAIGLSAWLFGDSRRIGRLSLGDLADEMVETVKTHPVINIVDVRVKTDRRGHGYFLSSPAALSDLILVLRDGRAPGAANGRPLIDKPDGFWELREGYPQTQETTPP